MKKLEERILKDGKIFAGDILKIDCFLNHQIDVKLMDEIGEEFHRLFIEEKPNKILTIEASGIAIAVATSKYFDYIPVVFAKKTKALNMDGEKYCASEKSYTRGNIYNVEVAKEFLNSDDNVLIIDDFLATGEAMACLLEICRQANAKVVGCGAVVSKTYQDGEKRIKDKGHHLEVLARVKSMKDGKIIFEE